MIRYSARGARSNRRQGLCLQSPEIRTTSLRPSAKWAKAEHTCRPHRPKASRSRPSLTRTRCPKMTSREIEILRLLSAGKSLSEIAWLVHSSYKTIANTSSIMRQKLACVPRPELVRLAIESSLNLIPAGNPAIQLPIFQRRGCPTEPSDCRFPPPINHNDRPVSGFPRRDAAHFGSSQRRNGFASQPGTSDSLPADTADQKSRR